MAFSVLVSYKISVQASDLSKALNPEIWPLRVKAREYIHYARKKQPRKPQNGQADQPSQVGHGQARKDHVGLGGQPAVQPGQGAPQNQLYPNLSNMNLWNVLRGQGVPNPNL